MLLGLLADDTNLARQVLNTSGITFSVVQPFVVKWLGVRPEAPEGWHSPQMPLAPRAKLVIELALGEAKEAKKSFIDPEHLLLGILDEARDSGGLATYILDKELGIDLAQLEQQLREAMSR